MCYAAFAAASFQLHCNRSVLNSSVCGFAVNPLAKNGREQQPCTHRMRSRRAPAARLLPLQTGLKMEVIDVPPIANLKAPPNEQPMILFVHGALHGAWCYKYFQQYFAERGYVTKAISLRGCGESEIEQTSSTTVSEHMSDLNDAIPQIAGAASVIIVAHSIGGFLVQKWIEQNTSVAVDGMVLMASSPPTGNSQIIKRFFGKLGLWTWLRFCFGFIRQSAKRDVRFCRELFFSRTDSVDFLEEMEGDERLREHMQQFNKTKLSVDTRTFKSVVESTGGFGGEVLVICAAEDMIVDREASEETAEFWKGELKVIDNAPHDLMLYSKWEKAAELILKWIRKDKSGKDGQALFVQSSESGRAGDASQ